MAAADLKQELQINGMMCGHCRAAVHSALAELPGVSFVSVDLDRGTAIVEGNVDLQALLTAVEEAGYEAAPLLGIEHGFQAKR